MKPTVLLLTVLGCVTASPNGYYHQEYNYKTSSSSYKNNELQHQTDDQGYYRKDGDLEGKVRPRVDANSEHSEYVNPNLRNGDYNAGVYGGTNEDLSSSGHMRANVGSFGSHGLTSEGLAHTDRIVGTKSGAYSGYGSGSFGSNSYGSRSYATSSNLQSVTSHIQQELERDLQHAIQENRAYSQSGVSVAELERELRQNLTNRLNTELTNRYGQQSVRGGLSYTISGGRLHSTANYDNQELQDLRAQLENNLLNQLRSQYYQSSSHYQTHQSSQNNYGYSTTIRPVYYTHYPVSYVPDNRIRYTPISNPESITTIASRVQNQLDTRLNGLLEDVKNKYFSSSSSYSLTNANLILENLRNDLRNNITYLLNENVKNNYGNQIPRDGYMYSVGPSDQTSTEYNYSIKDLENLRSQIERNLIEKLNRDFETYKTRWYQQTSSQSQTSQSNLQYGGYSTPRYDIYNTPQYNTYDSDVEHFSPRPSSSHIVPLISSGGGGSSNRRYNIIAGSRQSGYEISGGSGSSSIAQLQRQLQQDLSRQLQAAINRGHYGSYSTSGSYNPQSYQSSLQELSDELNRNLTRQLQQYSASGYYSSYGNFDQAQLANLRSQLEADLMRQLQQGLQQSFQSSSSYSASSSSSSSSGNYRPVRGFDSYQSGQYRSGGNLLTMNGEDCVGDDPNAYNNHRTKRSYQPYRSRPLGVGYGIGGGYSSNYGFGGGYSHQQHVNGQLEQVDQSDLTQQTEDASFEKLQQGPLTQQQVDSELTQQIEDSGIGKLQLGPHNEQQISLGQQVDDSDLTQQVEVENFGKLQLGSQNQQQISLGQQVDDSDLIQQVEAENFGQLQQINLHQVDDSDLTQVEQQNFGQLQLGSQQAALGQQVDDSDLTQVEGVNFGQPQLGSQHQQVDRNQQFNANLTQQVEDSNFGKLQIGSQVQQVDLGHQVEEPHLPQQVEDLNSGKLQLGSQGQQQIQLGQQVDDSDSTQQVEDSGFGKLQLGSHGQQQIHQREELDNSDLTQQVEGIDFGFGSLQLNSQNQQQLQYGLTQNSHLDHALNNQQRHHIEQEDNSDLTQQVEGSFTSGIHLGSLQHPQQSEDFVGPTSQGQLQSNFGKEQIRQSFQFNHLLSNFNQNQKKVALQLESELSKQLQDAVKSYTISYSGLLNYKSTYEDLFRELKRNLTKQLDTVGPSGGNTRYTYSFVFSGPQIDALKKQLESELKLQLQNEISTATNNGNLNQQINQQTSNIGLHHNSDFSDQITQQKSNSEITQQQQNGSENLELGGQSQTTDAQPEDLTQQIGYDQTSHQQREFGQRLSHGAHLGGSSSGRLQLGTQHVEQQSSYDQSDVTQQVESNPFENSQLRGQQQIDAQSTNQFQQVEEVNPQLTQAQLNLPGKLQFGNKLINQKPIDSSNFINTEIDRQQHLYPHQDIISQQNKPNNKPNRLPTLNQVIQQQQSIPDSEEPNTQYPIEPQIPLSNLYQQQTEDKQQQKQDIDLYQQSQNSIYQIGEHAELGAEQNQDGQSASGHGFATNTPLTYTQILRQGSQAHTGLVSGTFQTNPFDRGQNSFDTYLNKQQIQLAHQLENELSRQLQDVISQNYYTITHSTGAERQEFLKALQTNITKQLEQILNGAGYSTHLYYGSGLTQEQKDKLKNELQASLSRQIQHDLQISYHIQQQNNGQQNAFDSRVTSESTAPHGSGIRGIYNIYGSNLNTQETEHTNQLHYGQQEVVPDSETASELHPLRPEQATVVQNVESNYNTGIKGPKRPGVTFESNSVVNAEIHYPQSEPTTQSVVQSSEPQEIADLNETPQENLPWWKRVGKKIKQGATSLKEKIIG